ncbi:MAG: hypothetical protein VB138_01850 [Burkholderia sp.]
MNMKQLQEDLEQKNLSAKFVHIKNSTTDQQRVYLNVNSNFDIYFIGFESRLFLHVWVKRPKDFDPTVSKSAEEEAKELAVRRKAKFTLLTKFKELGIEKIEEYSSESEVNLKPKTQKLKLDLDLE